MITVAVDTRKFEEAFAEFARAGRKDLDAAWREQGGILVGHMIALTPPGGRRGEALNDRGGVTLEARRRGESRIAADLAAIFPTTKAPEGEIHSWIKAGVKAKVGDHRAVTPRDMAMTEAELERAHRFARNPATGRTRVMGGINATWTRAALLKRYIRKVQMRVGLLDAGWLEAADQLKTAKRNTPAWVLRHGKRAGAAQVTKSLSGTSITISNFQAWFPIGMGARVALALRRREYGLKAATEAILERRAKAAERRQGR